MSTMALVNNEKMSENDKFTFFENVINDKFSVKESQIKECFDLFDANGDEKIDEAEWNTLTKCLFKHNGESYTEFKSQSIFKLLDENQCGSIDFTQFKEYWHHWFKQVLDPVSALVIVDVQNDFISGTLSLQNCPAKQDGEAVVPVVNNIIKSSNFNAVIYSCDWHPKDHISFVENVKQRQMHHTNKVRAEDAVSMDTVVFCEPQIMEQKLWPAHCVQGTWGAQLHPQLKIVENAIYIKKGTNADVDSYSAFWDNKKLSATSLADQLTKLGVTDVYVCGLAYDVCVGATAAHSLEHGFRTVLVEDASRGAFDNDIEKTRQQLIRQGAVMVESSQVPAMVSATDRKPELGHHAALNVAMARRLLKDDNK